MFAFGRSAGQTMQRFKCDLAPAIFALDLHRRIEGNERHAKIRRMGGDAGLAPAEHGVQPILAVASSAPSSRLAFVAGAGDIVKIPASRSLQEIASDGGGIAKLGRSA